MHALRTAMRARENKPRTGARKTKAKGHDAVASAMIGQEGGEAACFVFHRDFPSREARATAGLVGNVRSEAGS